MIIDEWLQEAYRQIEKLDAELIALAVFGLEGADRSWLITHGEEEISERAARKAQRMLERRAQGEPLAYILGEREFFGRNFCVNPQVLVPRVDTEALIYLVQSLELPKSPRFLEIGTGSGCIAITLALEFPQAYVLATDVSPEALELAQRNDAIYEGRVDFVLSDLLEEIDPEEDGNFDVLVANLPYVDLNWGWLDPEVLKYEPEIALYAADGGLSLYHRLFQELQEKAFVHQMVANCHESEDDEDEPVEQDEPWIKYLVLEADPCQHGDLKKIAGAYGWRLELVQGFGMLFVPKG